MSGYRADNVQRTCGRLERNIDCILIGQAKGLGKGTVTRCRHAQRVRPYRRTGQVNASASICGSAFDRTCSEHDVRAINRLVVFVVHRYDKCRSCARIKRYTEYE